MGNSVLTMSRSFTFLRTASLGWPEREGLFLHSLTASVSMRIGSCAGLG